MPANEFQEALDQMHADIRRDVAGGFLTPAEICDAAVDVWAPDFDPQQLRVFAEKMTHEALQDHRRLQNAWPKVTDCDRLDAAFAELERGGIVARQNFSCCGNCGAGEIWDEMESIARTGVKVRGYTFYHMQNTWNAVDGCPLDLSYGAVREGKRAALTIARKVVVVLRNHGLATEWNGTWQNCISVLIDWKRRCKK